MQSNIELEDRIKLINEQIDAVKATAHTKPKDLRVKNKIERLSLEEEVSKNRTKLDTLNDYVLRCVN